MKVILFTNESGVSVMSPNPECGLTVEQIALKDVPEGIPFLIVDADAIPETPDFSQPAGFGATK